MEIHAATWARDIPDNYAKVDGVWHHIPDEHFITVEVGTNYNVPQGIDWRMEHSLPCRVRGMADCEVQEVWELHLKEGGFWPKSGRYRIWLEGKIYGSYADGDVPEDGRTIHWEEV